MKVDIDKFSAWLEKTAQAAVADEVALQELKLSRKHSPPLKISEKTESLQAR